MEKAAEREAGDKVKEIRGRGGARHVVFQGFSNTWAFPLHEQKRLGSLSREAV